MERLFDKTSPCRALAGLDGLGEIGRDDDERHLAAAGELALEQVGDADGRVAARVVDQVESADEVVERVVGAVAVEMRAVRAHGEGIGAHRTSSRADQEALELRRKDSLTR